MDQPVIAVVVMRQKRSLVWDVLNFMSLLLAIPMLLLCMHSLHTNMQSPPSCTITQDDPATEEQAQSEEIVLGFIIVA
eukprot:c44803_g1_i1 orf=3-233(-)